MPTGRGFYDWHTSDPNELLAALRDRQIVRQLDFFAKWTRTMYPKGSGVVFYCAVNDDSDSVGKRLPTPFAALNPEP